MVRIIGVRALVAITIVIAMQLLSADSVKRATYVPPEQHIHIVTSTPHELQSLPLIYDEHDLALIETAEKLLIICSRQGPVLENFDGEQLRLVSPYVLVDDVAIPTMFAHTRVLTGRAYWVRIIVPKDASSRARYVVSVSSDNPPLGPYLCLGTNGKR